MNIGNIKRLAVLGAGESGVGAAILGMAKGMEVIVSDSGTISPKYREVLTLRGIPFEEGGHSEERILASDIVVKSPGIPPTAPVPTARPQQRCSRTISFRKRDWM